MPEAERQQAIHATLTQREGRPEHVAQAVLFFLADDFVTGVCLPVDGGRTIFRTPGGVFALARREDAVALLLAAPDPAAAALDAMLEAVRPRASRRGAPRPRRGAQPGCPRRDRAAAPG